MSLEKAKIDGVIYDVMPEDEYDRAKEVGLVDSYTAVKGRDGLVYPVRPKSDYRPGYYDLGYVAFFNQPTPEQAESYSQNNIINFRDASNMREIIQTQQRLANAESSILTTIDNVFNPEITNEDTPEMAALKQAILDKGIDLDKYEHRFGPNYNNDKRLLRKNSITFGKLRSLCNALDIKATITFEDTNPTVPNPIGKVITTVLTSDNDNCIIEEDE